MAATPNNPNIVFIADDGGLWRLDGSFSDVSSQCASRGISGATWLIAVLAVEGADDDHVGESRAWHAPVPEPVGQRAGPLTISRAGRRTTAHGVRLQGRARKDSTALLASLATVDGGIDVGNPNVRMHTFFIQAGRRRKLTSTSG